MFGQELAEILQFEIIIYTGYVTLMSIISKTTMPRRNTVFIILLVY